MKSWPDRMREWPLEEIKKEVTQQKYRIEMAQRDSKIMEQIIMEKESNSQKGE